MFYSKTWNRCCSWFLGEFSATEYEYYVKVPVPDGQNIRPSSVAKSLPVWSACERLLLLCVPLDPEMERAKR